MTHTAIPDTPLAPGDPVADFTLQAADGATYDSRTARQNGLLLAVLFKTGCGTCRYAYPFLQRLHEQYAANSGGKFQVWGISQDDAETTLALAQENGGATFPLLLDTELDTTVRYGITSVPDLYLLGAGDTIAAAVVGHFSRDGFNDLARQAADYLGVPYVPVVRDTDDAPAIKPG
jgi:cytochrome c biogenesis protein CcmG, thiol:disulfide interchange protein DsbE